MQHHIRQKKRIVYLFSLFFISLHLFSSFKLVYGENILSDTNYEVKPILNDIQKNMGIDYFYYETAPDEQQKISLEIINHSDSTEEFIVSLNKAYTNSNGMIDYSTSSEENKQTNEMDISSFTKENKRVITVNSHQSKEISFELKLPKEKFKGILLGGLYIEKKNNKKSSEKESSQNGIQLKQSLAYAVAVMLQEEVPFKENSNLLSHSLMVDSKDHQSVLSFDLENPQPNILNNVQMVTNIYKENDTQKIYATLKKEQMSFAPKDRFKLNIPWTQNEITEGKYRVISTFSSGTDQWKFEHTIEVTNKDIKNIVNKGIPITGKKDSKLIYWLTSIIVLLIIYLLYLKIQRRKCN